MSDFVHKIATSIAGALAIAAILALFAMWKTINTIDVAAPYQKELLDLRLEQIRQGVQLNSQQLDVADMERDALESRIRALENDR